MPPFRHLSDILERSIDKSTCITITGRVTGVTGTLIKARIPEQVKINDVCLLSGPSPRFEIRAEVVGFIDDNVLLTPMGDISGICTQTRVEHTGDSLKVGVGHQLLGRILDGFGNPIDTAQKGRLQTNTFYPLHSDAPDPLSRPLLRDTMPLGIKAIDALLTCCEGQRIGIFGAAGTGKSVILSMLVKNAGADVIVVALVGERGREVREFLEYHLGEDGMRRSVVVVATSDKAAAERLKAPYVATSIAEYFRDQGKKVLLLVDSVTRFARAKREIALAAGEPPSRRGFPPSVFPELSKLMERSGNTEKGSITGIYTILVEGDDMTEPIADETRSIVDGHVILSRQLAAENHFPAIDILNSLSRVMNLVAEPEHRKAAEKVRQLLAKYEEIELLIKVGEYQAGTDPVADEAIKKIGIIQKFLRQQENETFSFKQIIHQLRILANQ